jgi:hypothetical protein
VPPDEESAVARRTSWNRAVVGASAGACVLLLSACGGTKAVSEAKVEQKVSEQLTAQVGQKPDDIDCPGDLKAEKGTTMRCTLTAGDTSLGLTVTVTSVDGSNVKFDIQVDDS